MRLITSNVFRQLWRQRLFTLLNVLGLGVSISACWVIYRIVSYEYSFDDRLPDKALTYRLASPIAWWGMGRWLEDFVYCVKIEWWMFVVSGAAAIFIAMPTVSFQAIRAALANPVKSLRTV